MMLVNDNLLNLWGLILLLLVRLGLLSLGWWWQLAGRRGVVGRLHIGIRVVLLGHWWEVSIGLRLILRWGAISRLATEVNWGLSIVVRIVGVLLLLLRIE